MPDPCLRHPELPAAAGRALMRGLEKDPDRRPASAGELAAGLGAAAA